jgi:CDP-paratose 2-epimerase
MKILVTGGAGFVGSSLCLQLKRTYPDYSVVALDNLKRSGSELNVPDLKHRDIAFIHGDIRCQDDLEAADDFDVLIEASAEPSVMAGISGNPSYVINNNLFGSVNCFNTCLKNKARLIFLSTSRVYPIDKIENAKYVEEKTRFSFADDQTEPGISKAGISEELGLLGARSFYGSTKLASELLIQEYAEFYGLSAAITRFSVIAGPRQMGKTDQGIATLWMAKHFWKQPLRYIGYGGMGKQVRDILHIDDLVQLIDLQIHQPEKFAKKIFNAGGGLSNSASLAEMTKMCAHITGNKIPIASEDQNRMADLRCFITDNAKIQDDIGWQPKRDIEKIFTDIFHWIKDNEAKLKPILA